MSGSSSTPASVHQHTTLLMPTIDNYQRGYQKQVIQNCDSLQKVAGDYLEKVASKITSLEQRAETLKAREKKVFETVQNLFGAKSVIRIETPRVFPFEIDYDVNKIAADVVKADPSLHKNEAVAAQLEKSIAEAFSLHDPKIKGEEPKVSNNEVHEAIKSICQSHRVPIIYPINTLSQNGHLDKLYVPRTQMTKRKMKYIDSSLIFNTKNSVFYHFVPDRPAEKRNRINTSLAQVANPILESGNLTNFNINLQRHDDALESGYVPKTTSHITLLDAPADSLFGDNVMDFNFLNDKSNALFGGETNFYFDELMKQKPVPVPQATTAPAFQSDSLSTSTVQSTPTASTPSPAPPMPPPGTLPQNVTNMPPAPAGSIPPPPPLSILANLGKKPDEEGGNVADHSAPLKPITEEKSSLF